MTSARRLAAPAVAALLLLACGEGETSSSLSFGDGRELGRSEDGFDAVSLVTTDDGLLALWSAGGGLHARKLASDGSPTADAERLFVGCRGGLDAARTQSAIVVGCLRRPQLAADKPGEVVLLWLDPASHAIRHRLGFGRAGRDSRGIDLATDGETVHVAWHDGTPGRWRVRVAEVGPDGVRQQRALSTEGVAAGVPSVLRTGGGQLLAWAETWTGGGKIVTHDTLGAPRRFEDLTWRWPTPRLGRDGRGLLLAFRDRRPDDTRPNLFVVRLDGDTLRPAGQPQRVARANVEDGTPRILQCLGKTMLIAPRTWGTTRVIGITGLDEELERTYGEHQIYEWAYEFTMADAACAGDSLVVLAAGISRSEPPRSRLDVNVLRLREGPPDD